MDDPKTSSPKPETCPLNYRPAARLEDRDVKVSLVFTFWAPSLPTMAPIYDHVLVSISYYPYMNCSLSSIKRDHRADFMGGTSIGGFKGGYLE